jgi:hypothetical protein
MHGFSSRATCRLRNSSECWASTSPPHRRHHLESLTRSRRRELAFVAAPIEMRRCRVWAKYIKVSRKRLDAGHVTTVGFFFRQFRVFAKRPCSRDLANAIVGEQGLSGGLKGYSCTPCKATTGAAHHAAKLCQPNVCDVGGINCTTYRLSPADYSDTADNLVVYLIACFKT